MKRKAKADFSNEGRITLKTVADYVRLSPGTVSAVINDSPAAKGIPQQTRNRILAAVRELNYQPNFFARSLRNKRTYTVGVIMNEIGASYSALITAGIENYLRPRDYFFITGIHHHNPDMLEKYANLLVQRGVEGFITLDLNSPYRLPLPTVAIAGHRRYKGVTNIILDHHRAASIALRHLTDLGHRRIGFMKGHPFSSDSVTRWRSICEIALELQLPIDPDLIVQIESQEASPELGYPYAKRLLARNKPFTALFAFNDISAIGAIRAIREAGLRVPQDISVVGFDDIDGAAFHNPSLTTVRQPLFQMGEVAARALLEKIEGREDCPDEIAIQPELVVRESSARAPE